MKPPARTGFGDEERAARAKKLCEVREKEEKKGTPSDGDGGDSRLVRWKFAEKTVHADEIEVGFFLDWKERRRGTSSRTERSEG